MSKWKTPIYETIIKYSNSKPVPFHMPGHKLGKGIPAEFLKDIALLDITEIPGLDNLHHPNGVIKDAQELAAKAFGADETFFLVNGTTCGIHAAILTICKRGDSLIVNRDCHVSVVNGAILAGVSLIYVKPKFDSFFGIPTVILPADIEEALKRNPDAVGVLLTRPNYYGVCSDIEEITRIVHSYGKIIAVDEAHGAHLGFNELLPQSAMNAGVDLCIQSAHKTLPAFTQGAYLHIKGNKLDIDRLKFNLSLLQTSSPSYILMAFLDIARSVMENEGKNRLGELLEMIDELNMGLAFENGLQILSKDRFNSFKLDKTRIVINLRKAGITGFKMEKILKEKHNIQVEMSDIFNTVFISTISDNKEDFEKLKLALADVASKFKSSYALSDIDNSEHEVPIQAIDLKDIRNFEGERKLLLESVGKVCMDMITPYPPGIALICPGEIITGEAVEYIYKIVKAGGTVNGLNFNKEIRVVNDCKMI